MLESQQRGVASVRRYAGALVAVLSTLLLVACGGTATAPRITDTSPIADPSPTPVPAYAAELQPKLQALFDEQLLNSAVVVVRSPQGNWTHTFGTRTLAGNEPVTADDHVRIGSNTKTMTGTVILQLVQEGKLGLDDPIAKHLPGIPNGEQITIRQMLNMRSGLYNYTENVDFNRTLDEEPGKVWTPEELVAIGLAQPPYFEPDKGYHYSNTNTVLLGSCWRRSPGKPAPRCSRSGSSRP